MNHEDDQTSGELDASKLKLSQAWQLVTFRQELLSFHGCESTRDLPDDAFELLLSRSGALLTEADKAEFRAYRRGETEPEARLPKVLSRLQAEWLETFLGPKQ